MNIRGGISGVTEAARKTGMAANEVQVSTDELSKGGDVLKERIDMFMREIRAA